MEEKIEAGVVNNAIGLYINLEGSIEKLRDNLLSSGAIKQTEVLVQFNGVKLDYTFKDFLCRLGFGVE